MQDLAEEKDPFYILNDKLQPQVRALILENPSTQPGPETFTLGQGEWQVRASAIDGLKLPFAFACYQMFADTL
jgi:hypothetical protein